MSHRIEYNTYDEKVDKGKVQAFWDDYASHDDWQEGCGGLNGDIRWIDHICTDYNEAQQYIESHDKGWYDQLAVKYYEYPNINKHSTAYNKVKTTIDKTTALLHKYEKEHSIASFKSAFIGCPKCKSKLNKEVFVKRYANNCPLCGEELRGKTTIEKLNGYKKKINELNKQLNEELKKENEKNIKKAKVKWLVKVEWHC